MIKVGRRDKNIIASVAVYPAQSHVYIGYTVVICECGYKHLGDDSAAKSYDYLTQHVEVWHPDEWSIYKATWPKYA